MEVYRDLVSEQGGHLEKRLEYLYGEPERDCVGLLPRLAVRVVPEQGLVDCLRTQEGFGCAPIVEVL